MTIHSLIIDKASAEIVSCSDAGLFTFTNGASGQIVSMETFTGTNGSQTRIASMEDSSSFIDGSQIVSMEGSFIVFLHLFLRMLISPSTSN